MVCVGRIFHLQALHAKFICTHVSVWRILQQAPAIICLWVAPTFFLTLALVRASPDGALKALEQERVGNKADDVSW